VDHPVKVGKFSNKTYQAYQLSISSPYTRPVNPSFRQLLFFPSVRSGFSVQFLFYPYFSKLSIWAVVNGRKALVVISYQSPIDDLPETVSLTAIYRLHLTEYQILLLILCPCTMCLPPLIVKHSLPLSAGMLL